MDPEILLELVTVAMPFGRYKGRLLCDLPERYIEWFQREGFPPGRLGELLATLYEINTNGLAYLLEPLKEKRSRYL
jgi:uncharacterized protein (DUF3820 family)